MEKEEIILTFAVESQEAEIKIGELKKNIEGVKNSQDDLNQKFAEGTITLEDYNKETAKNNNAIRANEKAVQSLTDAVKDETESINGLRKQNSELLKERNALNLRTAEGRKRLEEINNQIDANNLKIRINSTQLEKQKINIGNYSSALQGLGGNLSKIIPGLDSVSGGISGITSGANAFSASPFGAVLAGIAVALNLAGQYLSKFTAAMDFLEKITTQVSAGFSAFIDNFDKFINLRWGELASNIGDAANEAQRLLNVERELDERNVANQINESKNAEILARLNVLSRNRTKTEQERIKAIEDAIAIEKKQNEEQIKYLADKLQVAYDKLLLSKKNQLLATDELIKQEKQRANQQIAQEAQYGLVSEDRRKQIIAERDANIEKIKQGETLSQQLKETTDISEKLFLLTKSGLFDEAKELQPVVDAYKELKGAQAGSATIQEKAQALTDKLLEQQQAAADKAKIAADKQAEADKDREGRIRRLGKLAIETEESIVSAKLNAYVTEKKLTEDREKQNKELTSKITDYVNQQNQAYATLIENQRIKEKALFDYKVKLAQDLVNALNGIAAEGTIAAKIAALGQIAIDTAIAISGLTKNSEANPANSVTFGGAAVIQFATGLLRIAANMAKAKEVLGFSEGGNTGNGSKYEPAGIVHKGEVVFSQRDVAMLGGAQRVNSMRPTFKGYADGGIVTSAATNPINQQFSIANAFKNMPPIYASWKEATEISTRVRFKESLTTV